MPEPLLLLPGMMCDARLFAPQIAALQGIADIEVPDLTRAGTLDELAAEVLRNAPSRFNLAGLSMGGMVALAMVAQAPERVERLALLATNHRADNPERLGLRHAESARVRAGDLLGLTRDILMPRYLGRDARANPAIRAQVLDMLTSPGPEIYLRQSAALAGRPGREDVLRRFPRPVLAISGAEDRGCPPELHRDMAQLAPRGIALELPGTGHLITLEAPDAVSSALNRWLAS